MARKKKKPAPEIPPCRPEPEGGPFEREKAFVDERRHTLRSKQDDDEHPDTDAEGGRPYGEEGGTHCGEEEDAET